MRNSILILRRVSKLWPSCEKLSFCCERVEKEKSESASLETLGKSKRNIASYAKVQERRKKNEEREKKRSKRKI